MALQACMDVIALRMQLLQINNHPIPVQIAHYQLEQNSEPHKIVQ